MGFLKMGDNISQGVDRSIRFLTPTMIPAHDIVSGLRSQRQQNLLASILMSGHRSSLVAHVRLGEATFLCDALKRELRFSLSLRHSGLSSSEVVVLSLSRESDGDFPKRGRPVCGEFRVGVCLGLVSTTCCFLVITAPIRSADFFRFT